MSWNDIIRRVLPPLKIDNADGTYKIFEPHTTSRYGWRTLKKGNQEIREFHQAGDFNYHVGPNGQTGINLQHPALRSPVTGIVTNAGEGTVGRIAIRDANGLTHEILHTAKQYVSVGDPVAAGQLTGTMGNTGTKDHHVHYQLKDPKGNVIDPFAYWDQQGPIDPNPAPPAYLDAYQRYLGTPGAAMGNAYSNAPNAGVADQKSLRRFQSPPTTAPVPYLDQTNAARQHFANEPAAVPAAPSSVNPGGAAPADPWTAANLPRSFDGRFGTGSWPPLAPPDNPGSPVAPTPQNYRKSEAPNARASTLASSEIPGSYFGRLLTGTAHLVGDDWLPSAQAASAPMALLIPSGPDQRGSFNNPFGNSTSSRALAPNYLLTSPSSAALISHGAGAA